MKRNDEFEGFWDTVFALTSLDNLMPDSVSNWGQREASYFAKMTDLEVGLVFFQKAFEFHKRNHGNVWALSKYSLDDYMMLIDDTLIKMIGSAIKEGSLSESEIEASVSSTVNLLKGELPTSFDQIIQNIINVAVTNELQDNFVSDVVVKTVDEVQVGFEKYLPYIFAGIGIIAFVVIMGQVSSAISVGKLLKIKK